MGFLTQHSTISCATLKFYYIEFMCFLTEWPPLSCIRYLISVWDSMRVIFITSGSVSKQRVLIGWHMQFIHLEHGMLYLFSS